MNRVRLMLAMLAVAVLGLWVGAGVGHSQQIQFVTVQPDCQIFFSFTAVGNTPTSPNNGLDNRNLGCTTWQLSYSNSGFSALSIVLQSAPDSNGTPGTYGTFSGTVINGSNPMTSTTQSYAQFTGANPWVRVRLNSATGSGVVTGAAYGWRIPSANNVTPPGGVANNVNLIQVASTNTVTGGVAGLLGVGGYTADGAVQAGQNPVMVGGHDNSSPTPFTRTLQLDSFGATVLAGLSAVQGDGSSNTPVIPGLGTSGSPVPSTQRTFPFRFNGSTWDREFYCTNSATISTSSSGNVQIIAASGSTVIRICHISVATGTPENIKLTYGTGANCGTGTTDLTGTYQSVSALAFDFQPTAALRGPASNAICINQANAQAIGGVVIYAQF